MPSILLIVLITLFVTLIVIHLCVKNIVKLETELLLLETNAIQLDTRNKIKQNSIIKNYQDNADLFEKEFMDKLLLSSQHNDSIILTNDIKSIDILLIPCYENSKANQFYTEFRAKETVFNKHKINFSHNLMNMNVNHVEQMLTNVLAKHLIDKNFVKGKYDIQNNVVRFSCNFYEKQN